MVTTVVRPRLRDDPGSPARWAGSAPRRRVRCSPPRPHRASARRLAERPPASDEPQDRRDRWLLRFPSTGTPLLDDPPQPFALGARDHRRVRQEEEAGAVVHALGTDNLSQVPPASQDTINAGIAGPRRDTVLVVGAEGRRGLMSTDPLDISSDPDRVTKSVIWALLAQVVPEFRTSPLTVSGAMTILESVG